MDISAEVELDETAVQHMDAVVDRFVVEPRAREGHPAPASPARCSSATGCCRWRSAGGARKADADRFYRALCSPTHHFVYGDIGPDFFMFNNPESACRTCGGLGVDKLTHPELLIPDPKRSILGGCFVREAFRYNPDTWDGRVMYSLSHGLDFSLDTPWKDLPERVRHAILYGIDPKRVVLTVAARSEGAARQPGGQGGRLRRHRPPNRALLPPLSPARRGQLADGSVARQGDGRAHLPRLPRRAGPRHAAALHRRGKTIHDVGQLNFDELHAFLGTVKPAGRGADAGRQVLREIRGRLELLLGIGLDYLNFNRRSATLSGGESQRIRLSTQIGSGLMGMLYVLDEPSIGLHPKDNVKMIATLERLRDSATP